MIVESRRMAKVMPSISAREVLMPITWPDMLTRGPPEEPEWTTQSVWMYLQLEL